MKPYLVVKIGGVVATDTSLLGLFLQDLLEASATFTCLLVHGGGKEVTLLSERLGYPSEFRAGLRITSPEEMDVVDMVLGGRLNIGLVRLCQSLGFKAVGIGGQDGGLFNAIPFPVEGFPECRTGQITGCNPSLVQLLCAQGYLPIVHSTCSNAGGLGLNVNADEAAQALAVALEADTLVYVSDIRGVLKNGNVLTRLDEEKILQEIQSGTIAGGMVPKVKNALEAVASGCKKVIIGGYSAAGDLPLLLEGRLGTTIEEDLD